MCVCLCVCVLVCVCVCVCMCVCVCAIVQPYLSCFSIGISTSNLDLFLSLSHSIFVSLSLFLSLSLSSYVSLSLHLLNPVATKTRQCFDKHLILSRRYSVCKHMHCLFSCLVHPSYLSISVSLFIFLSLFSCNVFPRIKASSELRPPSNRGQGNAKQNH